MEEPYYPWSRIYDAFRQSRNKTSLCTSLCGIIIVIIVVAAIIYGLFFW